MDQDPRVPEVRSSFPAGARCAHHPEREAVRTCTRCGNYLCAECGSSGSGVCLQCAARLGAGHGFPFNRDNYTLDGLLNLSLSRWKQHWLVLVLSTLVMFVVVYVPGIALELALPAAKLERAVTGAHPDFSFDWPAKMFLLRSIGQLFMIAAHLALMLMLSGLWLDLLEGKPADASAILARVRALPAQFGALIIIYFAAALCVVLGFFAFWACGGIDNLPQSAWAVITYVVLLLPGLAYALTGVTFVTFELAHDPSTGAIDALRSSWTIAHGKRWQIGGILTVSGFIAGIGALACCVGVLASFPLGMLLSGALYLALKNQARAEVAPAIAAWPV
jgi:hypothetical protein